MTKKLILILAFLFLTANAYSAELLVRAKGHWKDVWSPEYVATLSQSEQDNYNSRSKLCDIVVVRPDGWTWGNEECLPNFVVVKVPNLSYNDAKQYEQSNMSGSVATKHRQYYIKHATIEQAVNDQTSVITLNAGQFNGALKDKKVDGEWASLIKQ